MTKKYSFDYCENLMLKVFDDSQNGIETELGREVRESLLDRCPGCDSLLLAGDLCPNCHTPEQLSRG